MSPFLLAFPSFSTSGSQRILAKLGLEPRIRALNPAALYAHTVHIQWIRCGPPGGRWPHAEPRLRNLPPRREFVAAGPSLARPPPSQGAGGVQAFSSRAGVRGRVLGLSPT